MPLTADLLSLQQVRQQGINRNLLRVNKHRIEHIFRVADKDWVQEPDPDKLQPRKKGPCEIIQVHPNGTVKLQMSPSVTETVNLRKLTPYSDPSSTSTEDSESRNKEP